MEEEKLEAPEIAEQIILKEKVEEPNMELVSIIDEEEKVEVSLKHVKTIMEEETEVQEVSEQIVKDKIANFPKKVERKDEEEKVEVKETGSVVELKNL